MKLAVYDIQGQEVGSIDVDDLVFGLAPHKAALRQAMLAQLANRRAGSANTKTRSEVAGSTRKIRRQKGLGMARQGAIRAPHHRHGGIAFGPKPRSFKQALPKRVRRLAIRSALSAKVEDGELKVINVFDVDPPKTKAVADMLTKLGMDRGALIVTGRPQRSLLLSARNLPGTKVLPASYLNVVDLINSHGVVITIHGLRRAETLWGGERASKRIATIPPIPSIANDDALRALGRAPASPPPARARRGNAAATGEGA